MSGFRRSFGARLAYRSPSARQNMPFGRGGNRPHRIKSFDPTVLVKNQAAMVNNNQPETFIPKNTFLDFGFDSQLLANIEVRKYSQLTAIQDQVIPLMMAGRDTVGIANTGSGKTAAFLLPLIQKVIKDRNQKVLIMAPTRELALQIDTELRMFAKNTHLFSALCIGGVGMTNQIYNLRRNPNFVIGTPGRLKDLFQQNVLKLQSFNNLVLDEVDRILDMGFVKDMTEILSFLPRPRQSAFFSATTTPEVIRIMDRFLTNPVRVSVRANVTIDNIKQEIVNLMGKSKTDVLHNLLIKPGFDKVLVFGRTKHGLDKLEDELVRRGFVVTAIHGNKSQSQRQNSLKQFKDNQVKIMLATDLASRGLDIDNVTHVINFDLPESYEDYIHRIGRTGRANKTGVAVTLVG